MRQLVSIPRPLGCPILAAPSLPVPLAKAEVAGSRPCSAVAGDALSFLTAGRVPALVHWVGAVAEVQRLSMPFFLRPRPEALLMPPPSKSAVVAPMCQRELEGGGRTCTLPGCTKEANAVCGACGMSAYCSEAHQVADWPAHKVVCGERGKIHERWPWKADPYYYAAKDEGCGRGMITWVDQPGHSPEDVVMVREEQEWEGATQDDLEVKSKQSKE